jgi:peptidoglycan/LPS O-acetylase OafA/YrhL
VTPKTRVNELDLLRFVAALGVVFFHYSFRGYAADAMSVMPYPLLAEWAKYGYLGLELFFLISGFVILMTASSWSLQHFAISRFVRLYPAFWVCCTITFLMTIAIGSPRYTASFGQYLVNMTMLSGFVGVESMDGVYWSLYVELMFYAVVAAVLLMRRVHQFQLILAVWLLAELAVDLSPLGQLRAHVLADYSVCFIGGAGFFLIWSQGISMTRVAILLTAWGLATLQAFKRLPGMDKHYSTTLNPYVVGGVITTFFVVMLLVTLRRTGAIGAYRWPLVGALTYPLFLLHENIGFMIFNKLYPSINPHILFWGTIAAVMATALAVHVFVERPLAGPMKVAMEHFANRLKPRRDHFLL